MRTSWDILGIDATTTDKRVVKRAYAKMLAKYHPEEFPEKFEEISHAYKWTLLHCKICSEFSTIEPIAEPDVSFEITSEAYNDTEHHITFDDDLDVNTFGDMPNHFFYPSFYDESVFTSDIVSEVITEQEKQAAEALEEFRLKMCAAEISMLYDFKGQYALQTYVESESFKAVKNNPVFIEGLCKLLPSGYIPGTRVNILRKAFGIKKKWDANRYPSDLAVALMRLDEVLKKRKQEHNPIIIAIMLTFYAAIIIVLVLIISFVVNRVRASHEYSTYVDHCITQIYATNG